MADIPAPLAITHDQRGQNHALGLGGQTPSEDLAYAEGQIRGLQSGAHFSAITQETARLNDPRKLADEALRRRLENAQLEAGLETIEINNSTLDQRNRADLGYTVANTDKVQEAIRVSKETAVPLARAQIGSYQASAAAARANAAQTNLETQLKREYGGLEAEADILYKKAQATKLLGDARPDAKKGSGSSEGGISTNVPHDVTGRSSGIPAPQGNFDGDEDDGTPIVVDPIQSLANTLAKNQEVLERSRFTEQIVTEKAATQRQYNDSQLSIANQQKRMGLANAAKDIYTEAVAASDDVVVGETNYETGIPKILELSSAHKTASRDPEVAQAISPYIGKAIEAFGGAESILGYIDREVEPKNPEAAKQMRSGIHAAVVRSGEIEKLPNELKTIMGAGLGIEHIEDPEATYDKTVQMIKGDTSAVNDPELKNRMRTDPYIIAAQEASKNGTQTFTYSVRPNPNAGASPGIDSTQVAQGSSQITVFQGADGTQSFAPAPTDDKANSMLNLLDEVRKRQAKVVGTQDFVNQQVQGIQQLQADANEPAPVTAPATQQATGQVPTGALTPPGQAGADVVPSSSPQQNQMRSDAAQAGADVVAPGSSAQQQQQPVENASQVTPGAPAGQAQPQETPVDGEEQPTVRETRVGTKVYKDDESLVNEYTYPDDADSGVQRELTKLNQRGIQEVDPKFYTSMGLNARNEQAQKTKFHERVSKKIGETEEQVEAMNKVRNVLQEINTIAKDDPDLARRMTGPGSQINRILYSGKATVSKLTSAITGMGLDDDKTEKFINAVSKLEGVSMQAAMSNGFTAKLLDTPVESNRAMAEWGGFESGALTMEQNLQMAEAAVVQKDNERAMRSTLQDMNITQGKFNRIMGEYNKVNKMYTVDKEAFVGRRQGQAIPDLLKDNEKYQTPDQFIRNHPALRVIAEHKGLIDPEDNDTPPGGSAPTSGSRSSTSGGSGPMTSSGSAAAGSLGEPTSSAVSVNPGRLTAPPTGGSPAVQQAIQTEDPQAIKQAATDTKEILDSAPPTFYERVSNAASEIGSAVKNAVWKESQEHTPTNNIQTIQEALDSNPEVRLRFNEMVENISTPTGIDPVDAGINFMNYWADSFLMNKGAELGEWVSRGGVVRDVLDSDLPIAGKEFLGSMLDKVTTSKGEAALFAAAMDKAREEFSNRNEWTAGAVDMGNIIFQAISGGKVLRAGAAAAGATTAGKAVANSKVLSNIGGGIKDATPETVARIGGWVSKVLPEAIVDGTLDVGRVESDANTLEKFTSGFAQSLTAMAGVTVAGKVLAPLGKTVVRAVDDAIRGNKDARVIAQLARASGTTPENIEKTLDAAVDRNSPILANAPKNFQNSAVKAFQDPKSAATVNSRVEGLIDSANKSLDDAAQKSPLYTNKASFDTTPRRWGESFRRRVLEVAGEQEDETLTRVVDNVFRVGDRDATAVMKELGREIDNFVPPGAKPARGKFMTSYGEQGSIATRIRNTESVVKAIDAAQDDVFDSLNKHKLSLDSVADLQKTLEKDGFAGLIDDVNNSLLAKYKGKKIKGAVEGAENAASVQMGNNFKFLNEMRIKLTKQIQSPTNQISIDKLNKAISNIDDVMEEQWERQDIGGVVNDIGSFSEFLSKFKNSQQVKDDLGLRAKVLRTIQGDTAGKGREGIVEQVLKLSDNKEDIARAFGMPVESMMDGLKSVDLLRAAVDKGDPKVLVNMKDMPKHLMRAVRFAGADEEVIDNILKDGHINDIREIRKMMGTVPSQGTPLRAAVLSHMRNKFSEAVKTKATIPENIQGRNLRFGDLVGLGEQEIKNMAEIVGSDGVRRLNDVANMKFDRDVFVDLLKEGTKTDAPKKGVLDNAGFMVRRFFETSGFILGDIGYKTAQSTLSGGWDRKVANILTSGDEKRIYDAMKGAAELLYTRETPEKGVEVLFKDPKSVQAIEAGFKKYFNSEVDDGLRLGARALALTAGNKGDKKPGTD